MDPYPSDEAEATRGSGLPRGGALWIGGLGVAILAFAAFALSYASLRAVAVAGGISPSLAFLYPMIFDALLVVAFVAAAVLRSTGARVTWYPWTLIVLLLAAVGAGSGVHATGRESELSGEWASVAVAAAPLVALGLGFRLWMLMLAHARSVRRRREVVVYVPERRQEEHRCETDPTIVPGLAVEPERGSRREEREAGREPADTTGSGADGTTGSGADGIGAPPKPGPPSNPPSDPPSSVVRSSPTPPEDEGED